MMEALAQYIVHLGIFAVIAVIFAESGLLIGFFLPGDSGALGGCQEATMWSAHFLFFGCSCCVARVSAEMPKRTYPRHLMGDTRVPQAWPPWGTFDVSLPRLIAHSNEKLHILRAHHGDMSWWHCAALGPQA